MVISISGPAGSGKTTIAARIAQDLRYEHVYAGKMIRDMATENGMSIYEFNRYVEGHPEIDKEVDETIVRNAREGDKVLEGRLTGWMMVKYGIPALKIYFQIDPEIAAQRVAERDGMSLEEALQRNAEREQRHWDRFMKLYEVRRDDMTIYDTVIDTSALSIEELVALVHQKITQWA